MVIRASIFQILLPERIRATRRARISRRGNLRRVFQPARVSWRSFSLKTDRFRDANEQLVDNRDALAIAIRLLHKLHAVILRQYFRPRRMSERFTLKHLHLLPSSNLGDWTSFHRFPPRSGYGLIVSAIRFMRMPGNRVTLLNLRLIFTLHVISQINDL